MDVLPGQVSSPIVSSPIMRLPGFGRVKVADTQIVLAPGPTGGNMAAGFIHSGSTKTGS